MKKPMLRRLFVMACLSFGLFFAAPARLNSQAAEVIMTVPGTVVSGTTDKMLLLSTTGGTMEIKLDSTTDTSSCKILLPGKKVTVSLSRGSDAYLHAVTITADHSKPAVTVDTANTTVVTGTLGSKTTDEILYLKTDQGEMQIKFDPTTNLSGCSVLVMEKKYKVTCARGSDAYLHAVSISDEGGSSSGSVTSGAEPTAEAALTNGAVASVVGTVSTKTKPDILYLKTKDGTMQFKVDSDALLKGALIHTPGQKLAVGYKYSNDGYLHAAAIIGQRDEISGVTVDTANPFTVAGTVSDKSTQNILFLDTQQGTMELRIDPTTTTSNCRYLTKGQIVTVSIAYGSDAYFHALNITGY